MLQQGNINYSLRFQIVYLSKLYFYPLDISSCIQLTQYRQLLMNEEFFCIC